MLITYGIDTEISCAHPQEHRMVSQNSWAQKGREDILLSIPWLRAGGGRPVCSGLCPFQFCISPKPERLHSLPGHPVPTFQHSHREKSFLTSNKNLPHAGLCLWPLILSPGSCDPLLIPSVGQLKMAVRSALACCQPLCGLDIIPCVRGLAHWVTPAKVLSACMLASGLLGVHLAGQWGSFVSISGSLRTFWEGLQMITF